MIARRLLVSAAAVFAVVGLSVGLPGVAAAHSVLVSTDPARGSTVDEMPGKIVATFNEPLQPLFPAMTVIGPNGKTDAWQTGDPTVSGPTLSIALKSGAPAGQYAVNYRVTSEDGHPVSGTWSFTVKNASPAAAGTTGASTPASAPTASAASPEPDDNPDNVPSWPFMVGAIAAVAAALGWSRRGKH